MTDQTAVSFYNPNNGAWLLAIISADMTRTATDTSVVIEYASNLHNGIKTRRAESLADAKAVLGRMQERLQQYQVSKVPILSRS
jgi:4'-phosphopantetheinyl transferase EntD